MATRITRVKRSNTTNGAPKAWDCTGFGSCAFQTPRSWSISKACARGLLIFLPRLTANPPALRATPLVRGAKCEPRAHHRALGGAVSVQGCHSLGGEGLDVPRSMAAHRLHQQKTRGCKRRSNRIPRIQQPRNARIAVRAGAARRDPRAAELAPDRGRAQGDPRGLRTEVSVL